MLLSSPKRESWSKARDCEVRGQNVLMKKIMMIHAVTMEQGCQGRGMFGLSLAVGMFGLSLAVPPPRAR